MSRRRLLLRAWAFCVFALLVRAFASGLLPPRDVAVVEPIRIDVNRASVVELQALPGVGVRRAEQLVLERIRGGPFDGLEALGRVDGFGPGSLADLAPHVRFGPSAAGDAR